MTDLGPPPNHSRADIFLPPRPSRAVDAAEVRIVGGPDGSLIDFVRESNRIEGITREPLGPEIKAHAMFLNLARPRVADLENFVNIVAGAPLRNREGMNVRVCSGHHRRRARAQSGIGGREPGEARGRRLHQSGLLPAALCCLRAHRFRPSTTRGIEQLNRYEALKHAVKAHAGQVDKCGQPYILHPIAVAEAVGRYDTMNTTPYVVAALLHDVWEDTDYQLPFRVGDDAFSHLAALTRLPDASYADYIDRVCRYEVSCVVKLADLYDNLRPERQACLPPKERASLEARYLKARDRIWEALGYRWWPEPLEDR